MKIPIKIRLLLWYINRHKGLAIYEMSPPKARYVNKKMGDKFGSQMDYPAIPMSNVIDKKIKGRDAEIPIRIYQPTNEKGLPVIMYFHGGGFVIGDLDTHDKACRRIAKDNEAIVISVDYRLAPEHKFPAGLHDCYDTTIWATQNAKEHGGDISRLIVMGDSAGGNLATAVCLMSRKLNGPRISYQVLIYPATDARLLTDSVTTYGEKYLLTKKIMQWFLNHYQSKPEDVLNPYMSMVLEEDLSNMPPAFIFTAEYDPLKDEGKIYADKLKAAGNEVIFKDYKGLIHGFLTMPKMSKLILNVYSDIKEILKPVFEKKQDSIVKS